MSLRFTDNQAVDFDTKDTKLEAFVKNTSQRIVVRVTMEAIADYSIEAIRSAAAAKYDSGQFETNGDLIVRDYDIQN